MERRLVCHPVVRTAWRVLRWVGVFAFVSAVLAATPMCALPRAPASGPEVAVLSTGPFCARVARGARASGDHLAFDGGGLCRFCPERVSVHTTEEAPSFAAEWGFVGLTPVARRLEQTGCGASGCDYTLTAWWWQGGAWVVVTGQDGETDDLVGAGPPFEVTWGAIAASCGAGGTGEAEPEKWLPSQRLRGSSSDSGTATVR